jgi:alkanesulfonate monooxygenase SsuD/methylene tetrahydromethanopterin reductase-like flavin-dependent oxidoreductase (luciferase family)
MRFGLQLPQGFFGELTDAAPDKRWDRVVSLARDAEEAGFAGLYSSDHLLPAAGHAPAAFADATVTAEGHDPILECWTTLVAVSQHTSRIQLGQLVMAAAFRNPGLVAKMVATLDVISGGRTQLGIGAGWLDREFEAYGYEFGTPGERIEMMSEAIDVIRSMWTKDVTDHAGVNFTVTGAPCDPKPLQSHVPILVGAFGRRSIGVVARKGDRCNFMGNPRQYAKRLGWLLEHCADIGRDEAEIDRTWLCNGIVLARSKSALEAAVEEVRRTRPVSADYLELALTTDDMCRLMEEYRELGISEGIVRFTEFPERRSFDLFVEHVMPALAD